MLHGKASGGVSYSGMHRFHQNQTQSIAVSLFSYATLSAKPVAIPHNVVYNIMSCTSVLMIAVHVLRRGHPSLCILNSHR